MGTAVRGYFPTMGSPNGAPYLCEHVILISADLFCTAGC